MLNKGNTMHQTVNFPVLPAIEFYQVRMLINKINNFNHNILSYDPSIFNRIKRIATQAESLNEQIRNSLPIMKLKTRYIIDSTISERFSSQDVDDLKGGQQDLELTEFIDDFTELKNELEKLTAPLRTTSDYLLALQLEEANHLKSESYRNLQNRLLLLANNNQKTLDEFNQELIAIVKAEEVILNYKLADLFDHVFPDISLIESLNIPPSKKDLLKIAIACAKRLLTILDNGLDFIKLVNVRLYLVDQIAVLNEKDQQFKKRIDKLTHLLILTKDISKIDEQRQDVAAHFQQLQSYLTQWIDYMQTCLDEQTFNIHNAIKSCEAFMDFINEAEYQYQRQLAD
ncbi:alpha-xenorhabdolysin family binary toxin subunit B [Providencia stuartii]|uniref:alpha-xenorhabdolysin family binary toxin subunit B n=1 Tax=Providencia stuartii TaxID=588 RepID=UPI00201E41DF|nr:alpha-xenorhabdolysin family binary toxin subunit B [Providencia stuartii]